MLSHGRIPANLHFRTPNAFIDFERHRLKVVTEPIPLDHRAIIGVSSFGFGGANAHVLIAGVEERVRKTVEDLPVPFDRKRARALSDFYRLDGAAISETPPENGKRRQPPQPLDVRSLVVQTFTAVTNIQEIDPAVELTEQGLDSLAATQFLTTLQQRLGVELDVDLLFDYPLVDQLVAFLEKKHSAAGAPIAEEATLSRQPS
jgi:acyl carrier protein